MARVKLNLPDSFPYCTRIPVRISDINYGGHVGNDAVLSILQEARLHLLGSQGASEVDIFGASLIMCDSIVVYRSQAFYGETLKVEVAVANLGRHGFDFLYRVSESVSGREVARAKTGMAFFDYDSRSIRRVPDAFSTVFASSASVFA